MRLNIQTKLLLILLAIGVPTLLVMGVLGYANGQRTIRSFVRDGLLGLNASKARHVESYFVDLRSRVEVVAADRTVAAALKTLAAASTESGAEATEPAALWSYLGKTYPAVAGERRTEPSDTPAGRRLQELYLLDNPFPLGSVERERFLGVDASAYTRAHREIHDYMRRIRDADDVGNLLLVDAATRRIVYAVRKNADFQAALDGPLLRGTNLRETAEAALRGRTNVVDFQRSASASGLPVGYVSAPIVDGGRVIGCVVAQIRIDAIDRILSGGGRWANAGLGATGDSYIVGPDRKLRNDSRTLRDDPNRLFATLRARNVPPETIRYVEQKRTTVLTYALDTRPAYEVVAGRDGFEEVRGFTGASIFAAYQPLDIPGLRWGIISRRDTAEALSPMADFRRNAILTSLGALVLIAVLAARLAKSFVAPIEAMSAAARRFGQGERGLRLAEIHRDDEFGELARQFNTMVEDAGRHERIQAAVRRNIVHDLKTPVTVIKGMGETLLFPEMADDPTWRDEMLRAIVEQSDRLLDDLKDILQPIDDGYRPDLEEFDLALLVERIVKAEKHTTRASDHVIVTYGTNAPLPIVADRRKIRRLYENLLSNAIKYSPGTGKRVEVTLDPSVEGEIAVSFRDEGLGMDQAQIDQILVSGGRVRDHARGGIEGDGFGIDSVQRVLQAHGGRLEVASMPNKGSTFTAILPVRDKKEAYDRSSVVRL